MNGSCHPESFFLLWKNHSGPREHELPGRCRMDSITAITDQKWIANVGLYHFDLMTDSGLRPQDMLCCFAEVLALGNRNQIFQMTKLDDI